MAPDMALMAPTPASKASEPGKTAPAVPADPTAAIKAQVKEILSQPKPVAAPSKPLRPRLVRPKRARQPSRRRGTDAPCSPGSSNSSLATAKRPNTALKRAMCRCSPTFLGYRAYAAETQIFHLTRSKGFILELAPLMGADERIGDILTSIISDVLVAGCEFQIINYARPASPRSCKNGLCPASGRARCSTSSRYRLDLLRGGAWTSLATDGPFHLRQFRVLFAVGVGAGSGVDTETLLAVRDGITSALDSINVKTRIFSPTELIRFIDDVVCPATGAGDDAPDYSPFDPINEQCIRRDLVTRVEKDRLILEAPSLRPSGLVIDGTPKWPI
jgi:hypothetical protein